MTRNEMLGFSAAAISIGAMGYILYYGDNYLRTLKAQTESDLIRTCVLTGRQVCGVVTVNWGRGPEQQYAVVINDKDRPGCGTVELFDQRPDETGVFRGTVRERVVFCVPQLGG